MYNIDPLTPIVPIEEVLAALKNKFSDKIPSVSQCLMAICFLTANILPECVWGVENSIETRRGIKVDVKSIGLPIGAGLGSSASFSVALSASLLRLRQLMYGDLFPAGISTDEIAGDDSSDGWVPPASILNILNGWSYGSYLYEYVFELLPLSTHSITHFIYTLQ